MQIWIDKYRHAVSLLWDQEIFLLQCLLCLNDKRTLSTISSYFGIELLVFRIVIAQFHRKLIIYVYFYIQWCFPLKKQQQQWQQQHSSWTPSDSHYPSSLLPLFSPPLLFSLDTLLPAQTYYSLVWWKTPTSLAEPNVAHTHLNKDT